MIKKESGGKMGCYVMVTKRAVSRINLRAGHGKGKWEYSKGIFKIVKEMKISK